MISRLRRLDWHQFLPRPRLPSPSLQVLDTLYQQPVLVTGAAGSIGSALAKRLAPLGQSALLLLDSSESRLYQLQQSWAEDGLPGLACFALGEVNDGSMLDELFARHAPRIVFHAAAFKHVPLLEQQPFAAIQNNVFGTLAVTRAAAAHGARVVLLSTDKAVEPGSVMGATKRISEKIVLSAGGVVLRLGNVLATRGSVTETFALQLAAEVPLTVTDPAARRYFLTLDEAVNALLIAAAEPASPSLLAPELPPPQFITDLAHFIASQFTPGRPADIDFIGLRAGDKESERFWSAAESPRPAGHPGLLSVQSPLEPAAQLDTSLGLLRTTVQMRDLPAALDALRALAPEYTPSAAVRSLAGQQVEP